MTIGALVLCEAIRVAKIAQEINKTSFVAAFLLEPNNKNSLPILAIVKNSFEIKTIETISICTGFEVMIIPQNSFYEGLKELQNVYKANFLGKNVSGKHIWNFDGQKLQMIPMKNREYREMYIPEHFQKHKVTQPTLIFIGG